MTGSKDVHGIGIGLVIPSGSPGTDSLNWNAWEIGNVKKADKE